MNTPTKDYWQEMREYLLAENHPGTFYMLYDTLTRAIDKGLSDEQVIEAMCYAGATPKLMESAKRMIELLRRWKATHE